MSWMIGGKGVGRAREILRVRKIRDDITAAINDLELSDPGLPDRLNYHAWLLSVLDHLNRKKQLPKLFEELARQLELDNAGDDDARELRKIVENARPALPAPDSPNGPKPTAATKGIGTEPAAPTARAVKPKVPAVRGATKRAPRPNSQRAKKSSERMPRRIFLSYRREDSAGQAGRLGDRLVHEFGEGCLFMDVDGIPLGVDFVKRLTDEVASCDVLLAVIGPRWLELRDENNDRRLDNPDDFVRVEIRAALQRDIPLIPILLDGTKIPRAHLLPDDIIALTVRNGLDLRHASFHTDLDRLVRELKEPISINPERRFERIIYASSGRDPGFDFQGSKAQHWQSIGGVDRAVSDYGQGDLSFENGMLNIRRSNTEGRFEIWLGTYCFAGRERPSISADNLVAGIRRIRVSFEARAFGASHRLRVLFKNEKENKWVDDESATVSSESWTSIGFNFKIPPTEDCRLRIDDFDVTHAPSSVQIRNFVLAERIS